MADLSPEGRRHRITQTAIRNIENTIRIMHFMRGNEISLYRMSAQLIPLATHEYTDGWAWWDDEAIRPLLEKLGELIRKHAFRVSSHLPEVCVLSTPKPDVLQWLERYIAYHEHLFEAIGLDETAKIVIHVGGAYNNPDRALRQAEANFAALGDWARRRIVLENDDRVFSASQVLALARRVSVPVVFDYHHHMVLNNGEALDELLEQAFATWDDRPPKVHLSSPKTPDKPRAHADYVEWEFVEPFFDAVQRLGVKELDVMVEAKQKDLALIELRKEYMAHLAGES